MEPLILRQYTLLVLAANQKEYMDWARKYREEAEAKGFAPRWLVPSSLSYIGYEECFYTEVGSYQRTEKYELLYRYFEIHNITKI